MTTGIPEPIFSRRSFIAFLLLAPAGILCVFAIVMVMQYKQFKSLLAPVPELPEFAWSAPTESARDSLLKALAGFGSGRAGDSLWLGPADLALLLAATPAVRDQRLRVSVEIRGDSVFTLRTTQPIEALRGRVAWIFKKLGRAGFLNARVEGVPKLDKGTLGLEPDRGFLNGQKIPRAALIKRGGFSPGDFLLERNGYDAFIRGLATVELKRGALLLTRK